MEKKWKIIMGLLSIGLVVVGTISWVGYTKECKCVPQENHQIYENTSQIERINTYLRLFCSEWTDRDKKTVDELFRMLNMRYYEEGKIISYDSKIISYDSNGTNIDIELIYRGGYVILHSDEKCTDIEIYWKLEYKEEIAFLIEDLGEQNKKVQDAIRDKLTDYGFVSLTIAEPLPESIQYIPDISREYLTFNKETVRQIFKEEKSAHWSKEVGAWIVSIRDVPIIDTTRSVELNETIEAESKQTVTMHIPEEKTVFLTYPNTTAKYYIEFWVNGDTLLEGVEYNGEPQVLYLSDSCEYYYMLHYRYCGIYPEDLKLYVVSTDSPVKFEVYVYSILEVREHEARVYLEKSFIIQAEIEEDC